MGDGGRRFLEPPAEEKDLRHPGLCRDDLVRAAASRSTTRSHRPRVRGARPSARGSKSGPSRVVRLAMLHLTEAALIREVLGLDRPFRERSSGRSSAASDLGEDQERHHALSSETEALRDPQRVFEVLDPAEIPRVTARHPSIAEGSWAQVLRLELGGQIGASDRPTRSPRRGGHSRCAPRRASRRSRLARFRAAGPRAIVSASASRARQPAGSPLIPEHGRQPIQARPHRELVAGHARNRASACS